MADERRTRGAQRSSMAERKYAMTCGEVAEALGCSKQCISQIEIRALKKLRKGLLARGYGPAEIADLPSWLVSYWLGAFMDSKNSR